MSTSRFADQCQEFDLPTTRETLALSESSRLWWVAMFPIIASFGPLTIYSYGLMMAIGFLVAGYLTGKELSRKGYDGDIASSLLFWAAIGGVGGARILAILGDWQNFAANPIGTLFSGGGFVWYGGLIGGIASVSIAIHRNNLPWTLTVDSIAPGLALAHGIGRIGCHLAGDGDWGGVTDLPWGVAYEKAIIGWPHPPGVFVHPAPLYEMAAYFVVAAFLWSIRKKDLPAGTLFWCYLVLASGSRFFIEILRINPRVFAGLTEAQLTSVILVAIGAWKLFSQQTSLPQKVASPRS